MIARPKVTVDGVGVVLGAILTLVLLFMAMPILLIVVNSFNREHYSVFPPPGLSLRWYGNIARVPNLGISALNSFIVAAIVSVLTQVVAVLAAYGLARYRYPGLQAWRTLFLSPLVVPRVAFGVAAFIFFLRVRVLGGWWPFVLVHLLVALPFAIAVLAASLVHIPRETEEAAMDLGAHPVRMFAQITLPQMRTALVISTLFSSSFRGTSSTRVCSSPVPARRCFRWRCCSSRNSSKIRHSRRCRRSSFSRRSYCWFSALSWRAHAR